MREDPGGVGRAAYCPGLPVAVTPADSDTSGFIYVGVYVGTAGDLSVIGSEAGAAAVVYKNVANGTFLPISVKRIATASTATNIIGHKVVL